LRRRDPERTNQTMQTTTNAATRSHTHHESVASSSAVGAVSGVEDAADVEAGADSSEADADAVWTSSLVRLGVGTSMERLAVRLAVGSTLPVGRLAEPLASGRLEPPSQPTGRTDPSRTQAARPATRRCGLAVAK
jgi:hypothetical protein